MGRLAAETELVVRQRSLNLTEQRRKPADLNASPPAALVEYRRCRGFLLKRVVDSRSSGLLEADPE